MFTSDRHCVASQLWEGQMNITASRSNNRMICWIASAFLVPGIGFGEAPIIVSRASVVTSGQLIAVALALALTGWGLVFAIWLMKRP